MSLSHRFAREDAGKPRHARPSKKTDETPEFKEFWEGIWRSISSEYEGRASARDAFFHYVWWRDVDPQEIVDAARYYARNFNGGAKRLLVRNWLDRGFYEELAEKERAYQARKSEAPTAPSNVTPIRSSLPDSHFSRRWERGDVTAQEA